MTNEEPIKRGPGRPRIDRVDATATDEPQEKPKPRVVLAPEVEYFLERKGNISIEDMPTKDIGANHDKFELPRVGGEVQIGRSMRPRNIEDANPQFKYSWRTKEDLEEDPMFSDGWYVVRRDNDGGKNIPARYFNAAGVIYQGQCYLSYTLRSYYDSQREGPRKRIGDQLRSLIGQRQVSSEGGATASTNVSVSEIPAGEPMIQKS